MSTISPEQLNSIREQFPALHQEVNCKPLIYLDNGATTQKPKAVINALSRYYEHDNSNVHRGAHTLSDRATEYFENARKTVQRFLNAAKAEEIVWTRGTTEAINLVAATWGRSNIKSGDRILVSGMEHHSNIVPWQMLCEQSGSELLPIPVLENGELDMAAFKTLLTPEVKLVSVVHVSNALGTINPVADIIALAHANGSKVLIDGAQAVAHWDIDVQALDADFYAFSGHKLFGPTGIGVLYGKEALLNAMPPYQGGGEMIEHVSFSKTTYNVLPYKFEAGTPNIAGAIGMAAAIDYLNTLDRKALAAHEDALLARANELAAEMGGIRIIGNAANKASVFSFILEGAHPADVGTLLDQQGIAVRTGHHCAMPVMEQFKVPGTVRASFSFYNTLEEVDALFKGLEKAKLFLL
ncbi:aminotransferase class V-fold PLP-dependent enzyme [Thalassolituus alkanivorans]|uniref:aminotransferase class V-fold PLP-dependent enzyme n=1 Tax=Thalassolituus alkanivorans TaxID=2881055 RepID=UPI001E5B210B|nr:cysteine desulfurase [Thalassolituus alkanivorans]MCB2388279.1 cysteine desulfurase [Thalassolituus alkanivorans]MCB2424007.1 cysteine desulfurase [Thalassolituus alkanivorans]